MNKENLQKMASYIRHIPSNKFDMTHFRMDDFDDEVKCKSIGCVIGHCTVLDKKNIEENYIKLGNIQFLRWSEDFTGLEESDEWEWCFGMGWVDVDNTPQGAALRIEYLIRHGLPENWEDQMNGTSPTTYDLPF